MPHVKGVSKFTVRYTTRGQCKAIDKETRKWAERYPGGADRTYTYYKARITVNGKGYFLGHYATAAEAGEAYALAKETFTRE